MIRVRDRSREGSPILNLYGTEPSPGSQGFQRGGILDHNVCPTLEDLHAIGEQAIRILNRWPGSLQTESWEEAHMGKHQHYRMLVRHFVELWSLHCWNKNLVSTDYPEPLIAARELEELTSSGGNQAEPCGASTQLP